jgi:hypothetical protein
MGDFDKNKMVEPQPEIDLDVSESDMTIYAVGSDLYALSQQEMSETIDISTDLEYGGDIGEYGEPDPENWRAIVDKPGFRDPIESLDHIFSSNDYFVDMHIDTSSFYQVELESQPAPNRLTLMISNPYEEFTENVHHPFFRSMDREDVRKPKNGDVAVKFGGYDETREIRMNGLESSSIEVPTFSAYADTVFSDFNHEYIDVDDMDFSSAYDSLLE